MPPLNTALTSKMCPSIHLLESQTIISLELICHTYRDEETGEQDQAAARQSRTGRTSLMLHLKHHIC